MRVSRAVLVLAVVILIAGPFLGGEHVSLIELTSPLSISHRIFFELRALRYFLTLVAGGSLALIGGTYQILFHNPLAEPYLLGVSSAVALGAASAEIFLKFSPYSLGSNLIGCLFAFAAVLLLTALYLSQRGESIGRLVLFGMGLNFVLSSLLFLLLSYHTQQIGGGSMRWLFGQIPWITAKESFLVAGTCLFFVTMLVLGSRTLDALSLGDSVARTLGVAPQRARTFFLIFTSAYLAALVCFTGSIGFVGLVVPHTVRILFRPPTTRVLFIYSFVLGAAFLVASDSASRAILPPFEFPIGIVTTLVGGPIFLYLLWRDGTT